MTESQEMAWKDVMSSAVACLIWTDQQLNWYLGKQESSVKNEHYYDIWHMVIHSIEISLLMEMQNVCVLNKLGYLVENW